MMSVFGRRAAALLLMISMAAQPAPAFSAEEDTVMISLEDCLKLALEHHPSLRSARGGTRAAEAQLEGIRAGNRVTVGLNGSARYSGNFDTDDGYHSESASLSASKLLYDSGRTRLRAEIQRESVLGSRENERAAAVRVAANAKRAYYKLVLSMLNSDVEREKVSSLEEHLKTAQGQYDVGVKSLIDVTRAEADLANARVSLMRSESDILISAEALRVAVGADIGTRFTTTTVLELPISSSDRQSRFLGQSRLSGQNRLLTDELMEMAMATRPDYMQAQHTVRARELGIKSAARENSPSVTGSMGANVSKREGANSTEDYSASISISVPLIDGGSAAASAEAARAQLDQALAELDSLRRTMSQSVRSAALSLGNAVDRAGAAEISVRHAEENMELAQGRYEVGVGSALELSDAVSTLASARYTYYQALYDAQAARADLDEAIGVLPAEIQ